MSQPSSRRTSYISSGASSANNSPVTYTRRIRPLYTTDNPPHHTTPDTHHARTTNPYLTQYSNLRPSNLHSSFTAAATQHNNNNHNTTNHHTNGSTHHDHQSHLPSARHSSNTSKALDSQGKIKPIFSTRALCIKHSRTVVAVILVTLVILYTTYTYYPHTPSGHYTHHSVYQLNAMNGPSKTQQQQSQVEAGELVEFVKSKSILPTHLNTSDKAFSAIEYSLTTKLDLWNLSGDTSEWDPPADQVRTVPQAVLEGLIAPGSVTAIGGGAVSTGAQAGSWPNSRIAPPKQRLYSKMWCINSRERAGTELDRSCHFQNLCYSSKTNNWVYHRDPNDAQYPVLIDNGKLIPDMPSTLLNLRSMGNPADAQWWAPTVVDNQPIDVASYAGSVGDDVYVLYHPHYPSNIGHIIGDDYFAMFNLMANFGLVTHDVKLLLSRTCEQIFDGNPKKISHCNSFMSMLRPGISRHNATLVTPALTANAGSSTGEVCYGHVLAGLGPYGFQQSLGRAPVWRAYRDYYLSNIGLNPHKLLKQHRITISVKNGKRGIYNNDALVKAVQQRFSGYVVEAIELTSLGSWTNELNYLADTSVLVTPCGGVSMSAMFLPPNSALVVVDYYNTKVQNSVGMEEKLWANLGYIQAYHYPFNEKEVVLDETKFKRTSYSDMRDWGQVTVDVDRMILMIEAAIRHVDQHMVFAK